MVTARVDQHHGLLDLCERGSGARGRKGIGQGRWRYGSASFGRHRVAGFDPVLYKHCASKGRRVREGILDRRKPSWRPCWQNVDGQGRDGVGGGHLKQADSF